MAVLLSVWESLMQAVGPRLVVLMVDRAVMHTRYRELLGQLSNAVHKHICSISLPVSCVRPSKRCAVSCTMMLVISEYRESCKQHFLRLQIRKIYPRNHNIDPYSCFCSVATAKKCLCKGRPPMLLNTLHSTQQHRSLRQYIPHCWLLFLRKLC